MTTSAGGLGSEQDVEHGLRRHIGERRRREGVVESSGVLVVDRRDAKPRITWPEPDEQDQHRDPPGQHVAEDDAGCLLLQPIAAKPCTDRT